MKKLFTSLALAAMAVCGLSANAQKATIYVKGYYTGVEAEVKTKIEKLEDGSYSIPDFLGSGSPFSFKFTKPTESMKTDCNIEITSPCYEEIDEEYDIDAWYLTNEDGDDLECEFTSGENTIYLISPSVYLDDQTYIRWSETGAIQSLWTGKNYIYEYELALSGDGYISTNSDVTYDDFDYTYIDIYFDGIDEETPEEPAAETQPAKIGITTCNYYTYDFTDVVVDAQIEKLEDGSYSIPDFLNSGAPLTFKFEKPAASMEKGYVVEITSNVEYDADYDCYYLLTPEDDYLECEYDIDGTTTYMYDVDFYYDEETYVQWSETGSIKRAYDGEEYDFSYVFNISAEAYATSNPDADLEYEDFYYVWFEIYFNDPDTDSVSSVMVNNDAPVEYYNLQGVRVQNPSNGLFIRKQGTDVKKVIVK